MMNWLINCEWKFNLNTVTSILFSQLQPFSTPRLLQNFGNVTVFWNIRNISNFDAIVTNFDALMEKSYPFKRFINVNFVKLFQFLSLLR